MQLKETQEIRDLYEQQKNCWAILELKDIKSVIRNIPRLLDEVERLTIELKARKEIAECDAKNIAILQSENATLHAELKAKEAVNRAYMATVDLMESDLSRYRTAEAEGRLHIASIPDGTTIFIHDGEKKKRVFSKHHMPYGVWSTPYHYGFIEFEYGPENDGWWQTKESAQAALEAQGK